MRLRFFSVLLLIGLPLKTFADGIESFVRFDTLLISEPVTLSSIDDEWRDGNYQPGEFQFGDMWAEMGVKKGQWVFSSIYRQRQHYDFSSDTADFYNALENTRDLDAGRTYHIDLQAKRFEAAGMRTAYHFQPREHWSLRIGASAFKAKKLLDGGLKGTVTANSNKDYDYNVNVDYTYDEDVLFDRPNVDTPTGYGYALDLQAHWRVSEQIQIEMDVKDVFGEIRWKNVPRTQALATSDVKTVDADGFVKVKANLSGKEDYLSRFKQTLEPYGDVSVRLASKTNKNRALSVEGKFFDDQFYAGIGGETHWRSMMLKAAYYPELEVVTTQLRGKQLALEVGADQLNLGKARAIWLGLAWND